MKRKVVVRPEARDELLEAAVWYRGKSPLVAIAFRAAVREAVTRIAERPESFPEISAGIRRALTHRFPYAVFFAEERGELVILGVKHQAQDPANWPGVG